MGFREEFWQKISAIEITKDLSLEEKTNKLTQFEGFLKPFLPNSVFKYRSCNSRNMDALARNVLYAVPASYMNDPFDSLVYVDKDFIAESLRYGFSRKFVDDILLMQRILQTLSGIIFLYSILEPLLNLI